MTILVRKRVNMENFVVGFYEELLLVNFSAFNMSVFYPKFFLLL